MSIFRMYFAAYHCFTRTACLDLHSSPFALCSQFLFLSFVVISSAITQHDLEIDRRGQWYAQTCNRSIQFRQLDIA